MGHFIQSSAKEDLEHLLVDRLLTHSLRTEEGSHPWVRGMIGEERREDYIQRAFDMDSWRRPEEGGRPGGPRAWRLLGLKGLWRQVLWGMI